MLERATGIQIGRDPGGPEGMAGDAPLETHGSRAPLDHAPGVNTVHGVRGECPTVPYGRAEEGALRVIADAGGVEIGIERGFERMMRRHLVALAAFLMQ